MRRSDPGFNAVIATCNISTFYWNIIQLNAERKGHSNTEPSWFKYTYTRMNTQTHTCSLFLTHQSKWLFGEVGLMVLFVMPTKDVSMRAHWM